MIPFEFIVEGPPVSVQTRRRRNLQAWRNKVLAAARLGWPPGDEPSEEQLTIQIVNYYEDVAPDVDNIIKPIQDALIGLVYSDDSQITDSTTRKRNINGAYKIKGLSPTLAKGFVTGKEFLYVRIDRLSNPEELI